MPCSNPLAVTIDATQHSDFDLPEVVVTDGHTKDSTVFLLGTKASGFSILGTFDEILSFASSIVGAMYSWPIRAGHEEWLGTPVTVQSGERNLYVLPRRDQAGNPEDRGSGDKTAG